jgi:hypothetical protein
MMQDATVPQDVMPQMMAGRAGTDEKPVNKYLAEIQLPKDLGLGKTFSADEFPPELQGVVKSLVQELERSDEPSRRLEVKDAREAREFWNGNHYIAWDEVDQRWVAGNLPLTQGDEQDQDLPSATFVNYYLAYGLDFCAVIASSRGKTPFFPKNPDEPRDTLAAEKSLDFVQHFRRTNRDDVQRMLQAYFIYNDGVFFNYTRMVADADRFGTQRMPELEAQSSELGPGGPMCPSCGAMGSSYDGACPGCGSPVDETNTLGPVSGLFPVPVNVHEFPKADVVTTPYGRLEVRACGGTDVSEFTYLELLLEVHRAKMRALYPKLAQKISGASSVAADQTFEVNARRSLAEGMAGGWSAQNKLVTYKRVWIPAATFFEIDSNDEARDALAELFPKGFMVVFSDDVFCEIREEDLRDRWEVGYAKPEPTHYVKGVGNAQLPPQKAFNDLLNIRLDTHRFAISATFVNPKVLDPDSIADGRVLPGGFYPAIPRSQHSLAEDFVFTPQPRPSEDAVKLAEQLVNADSQRMTGIVPAVFGGVQGGAGETSSGYAQMRKQAMMRLQVHYALLRNANHRIDLQALKLYRKYGTSEILNVSEGPGGKFAASSVTVDDLQGEVVVIPESDDSIPLTNIEKREFYLALLKDPGFKEVFMTPRNIPFFKAILQETELFFPGEEARTHQRAEIIDLRTNPALAPVDPLQDHDAHQAEIQEWLEGEQGRRAGVEEPGWYQAVVMHWAEHAAARIAFQQEQMLAQAALMGPLGNVVAMNPRNAQPAPPQAA